MTDKPTYKTMNPRVILVGDGITLSKPIKLTIFNDDGTEADRTPPTHAELAAVIKSMFDSLPEDIEMRTLLRALEAMNRLAEGAALHTLHQMFILTHDEETVGHLDHDLMCPAVQSYFDENEVECEHHNDGAHMLNELLSKNQKLH